MDERPTPIPVNLITGFLGVGKTTAIGHLLARVPSGERWAVLINEFGEVGVDTELLESGGVAVRQVAGGCLCCVASQAFTVGLHQLIRQERPDRILIEPSGLGHPARVIDQLSDAQYQGVLALRAVVTLLDPRHLASQRHREHVNWQDQIALADVLVANKIDRCGDEAREAFVELAAGLHPARGQVALVEYGAVDPVWLDRPHDARLVAGSPQAHHHRRDHHHGIERQDEAWLTIAGGGDGYHSCGWRFAPSLRFDAARLEQLLLSGAWERVKGVVATERGWVRLNRVAGEGGLVPCAAATAGRLEIIDAVPIDAARLDAKLRRIAGY